jgi:hypothetical protein
MEQAKKLEADLDHYKKQLSRIGYVLNCISTKYSITISKYSVD